MSSGESKFKMNLKPEALLATVSNSSIRRMLKNTDTIITLKELNQLTHKSEDNCDVEISIIKKHDLISMLRQVKDHRGVAVYERAEIDIGEISHTLVKNYQTFVQLQKIASIHQLNEFFTSNGFSGVNSTSDAVFVKCTFGKREYAAFYVPPIIEYQDKSKIEAPLQRLRQRALEEPVMKLPGYDNNGDLKLQPIIDDWVKILSSSQRSVPILKDGTHRSYSTTLAASTIRAIIINESESLMQSVPIRTDTLTVTNGKPRNREDRLLGMKKIEQDRWEGWIDLGGIGIDG